MTAWIVRAGKVGEREDWALQNQIAGGGFEEVADLTGAGTRDSVKVAVLGAYPDALAGRQNAYAGQLWALRGMIKPGDVIVMPLKTTKKLAVGICSSGYTYRSQEGDSTRRHTIGVDWKRTDISRAAVKDDLLNTINGAMTIFQASKNHAEERLRAMIKTGIDPGSSPSLSSATKTPATPATDDTAPEVVDPIPAPTMEVIRDRVRTFLVENFLQHKLTHLVADILRVQGYVCDVSPEGPDFGVDIIAGRGPESRIGVQPARQVAKIIRGNISRPCEVCVVNRARSRPSIVLTTNTPPPTAGAAWAGCVPFAQSPDQTRHALHVRYACIYTAPRESDSQVGTS